MTEENTIKPAINLRDGTPNEMSAMEFQQRLYGWFEDKGLIMEVRAHLRKQMISALKDTAIGRTITGYQKHSISPKLQALNLLIAEFLLQQDYHYSLSVFSTEAPLMSILPEFQGLAVNRYVETNVSKKWQFAEKDMWDILETLGIAQDSGEGKTIYGAYYRNSNGTEPLLTCIVRMLHRIKSKSCTGISDAKPVNKVTPCSSIQTVPNVGTEQEWVKNISTILDRNNVKVQQVNEILNIIVNIVETEKTRLAKESREEYIKLQIKLQEHATKKEEEQKQKWLSVNDSFEFEKSNLEKDKMKRQTEIDNFKAKLQKQQSLLKERSQKTYVREREIHERECELQEREENLKQQQLCLQDRFQQLFKEQATLVDLRHSLQRQIDQTLPASELVNCDGSTSANPEHDAEQALIKNVMKQLQSENANLRSVNTEQKTRIEQLSQRAAVLMRDLENTQATVDVLSSSRHHSIHAGILSAPPLVATPNLTLTHHRNGINNYSDGGGEDGSRLVPPPPSREYRNYPNPRDVRRRMLPRRLTVHSSSSSDDPTTPTNDILQEARERLRRLEEESDEVDRRYRQFRWRRLEDARTSRYSRHSGHVPWLSNTDYDVMYNRKETRSASPQLDRNHYGSYVGMTTPENFISIPGPSRGASSHNSTNNFDSNLSERDLTFDHNINYETAIRDSNQTIQNCTIDSIINQPGSSIANLHLNKLSKSEEKVERDVENEETGNSSPVDSFDSSGVFDDILAAGTSGVSLSALELSDNSEPQPNNYKQK